jgi:phosphoribosylanthranilate isomerase
MVDVKICGIKTPEILSVAVAAGARYVGFVFVPESPRHVHPEQARLLARQLPTGVRAVGLFADPDDETLTHVLGAVPLDMIQLHGTETVARVQAIRSKFSIPILKAFPMSSKDDIAVVHEYMSAIDFILCDAKAPPSATITGGNGIPFDWNILKGQKFPKPWMLSGGLTADNVKDALAILTPDAVDVSSGVEIRRGIKDAQKIQEFIRQVHA